MLHDLCDLIEIHTQVFRVHDAALGGSDDVDAWKLAVSTGLAQSHAHDTKAVVDGGYGQGAIVKTCG